MNILIVRPMPNKVNLSAYNLQEVGLAKALVRKGHQCDVMYYNGSNKDRIEIVEFDGKLKFRILWLHGYRIVREGIYPSLEKYAENYDVIQVGGYIGYTSFKLGKKFPEKVVNYQGPYYCKRNKGDILRARVMDNTLLRLVDKDKMVVGTKSVLATEYVKSKGIQKVRTMGVGLDLSNIVGGTENPDEHEFVRKLIENKKNNKYLLYIGVLEERRNILFIIEVMKNIVSKYSDTKLILIGNGKKEYVHSCEQMIKEYTLQNNVFMYRRIEQKYMKYIYECCDAFILPTLYDIYGMVLLEAMYFGMPVFTTLNGGSSTMINESNGFVIKGFDKDEWASKIIEVFQNEELSKKIGARAKRTIEDKYTWEALADKFLQLYMEKVNQNN